MIVNDQHQNNPHSDQSKDLQVSHPLQGHHDHYDPSESLLSYELIYIFLLGLLCLVKLYFKLKSHLCHVLIHTVVFFDIFPSIIALFL